MAKANRAERRAAIHARLWELVRNSEEGARLPAERALAKQLGVARMTLRRAIDQLVAAGVVVREQGRGTFVTRPRLARQVAMTSFTEEMLRRGKLPTSEVLELKQVHANALQARSLRIPVNDPIFRFRRIRLADGEPIGLETTCTPADLVPDLKTADLVGSWYELLERRYGLHIVGGRSTIEPALLTKREAKLLRTTTPRPAFRIETTSFLADGRVIEDGSSLFRGDRYQLTAELRPLPAEPSGSGYPCGSRNGRAMTGALAHRAIGTVDRAREHNTDPDGTH